MKKIKLDTDNVFDITTENKLFIRGTCWENYYSVLEVHRDKIVIRENGGKSDDTIWIVNSDNYGFDIFILDKEHEPEHFLWEK